MRPKKFKLFQFSWLTGWVALIGGWSIFFTWILVRYFWAKDFKVLELIGFYWIEVFFVMCVFALLSLAVYVYDNRKELKLKMFFCFIVILLNIPSVFAILHLYQEVSMLTFLKVENNTGEGFNFEIHRKGKVQELGEVISGSSRVFNFNPESIVDVNDSYRNSDSSYLYFENNSLKDSILIENVIDYRTCFSINVE